MIRRPPRSTRTDTLLSLHDALPISETIGAGLRPDQPPVVEQRDARHTAGRQAGRERGRDPQSSDASDRSEEHTSELQSLMRISYAVFCLKKKKTSSV